MLGKSSLLPVHGLAKQHAWTVIMSTSTPVWCASLTRNTTNPGRSCCTTPQLRCCAITASCETTPPAPRGGQRFFVSASGRLVVNTIDYTFADLLGPAGIHTTTGQPHPRVGDLRHSFAVRTLLECYRGGADVQAQLPLLSTWTGHISPRRWASAADRGGGTPRINGSSSSGAGGFLVVATWSNSLRPRAECALRGRRRVETVHLGWSHWAISRSGMVPPWPRGLTWVTITASAVSMPST